MSQDGLRAPWAQTYGHSGRGSHPCGGGLGRSCPGCPANRCRKLVQRFSAPLRQARAPAAHMRSAVSFGEAAGPGPPARIDCYVPTPFFMQKAPECVSARGDGLRSFFVPGPCNRHGFRACEAASAVRQPAAAASDNGQGARSSIGCPAPSGNRWKASQLVC
jgi:hypothetical protein